MEIEKFEQWIAQDVRQSQYMMQIVKCGRGSFCLPFRSNYKEFFPDRFLLVPIPLRQSTEGLAVGDGGHYYSVATSLHLNRILKPNCDDQYLSFQYATNIIACPSVQIKDKKGKAKLEKRTCDRCSLYHSTIKAMVAYKSFCKGRENLDCDDEKSSEDEEDKMLISDDDADGDEDVDTNRNI